MDKNTLTGLLLMGLVIFGFMWLNKPSAEELERQRQERARMEAEATQKAADLSDLTLDSITPAETASIAATIRELGQSDTLIGLTRLHVDNVNLTLDAQGQVAGTVEANGQQIPVAPLLANDVASMKPSVAAAAVRNLREGLATAARYRGFARHLSGDSTTVTLANNLLTLEISNKGGAIARASLNDYKSYDSTAVTLLAPATDSYSFTLTSATQRFETSEFFFTPVVENDSTVTMMLDLGDGASWGIRYTLHPDSYLVGIDVVQSGMQAIIPSSVATMNFTWHQKMRRLEAGRVFEERNSALYYMFPDGDVDNLSEGSDDDEEINQRLKWISCKNQFFSAVLMARSNFAAANLSSRILEHDPDYIKKMEIALTLDYSATLANPASFVMYLGPNSYPIMKDVEKNIFPDENMHLTNLIPLGWPIFRWISTLIIIPVFSFLGSFISNYGIIILILTIFIKVILYPFTYKSLISHETPAGINGTLLSRRSQPHVGMPPHASADARPRGDVLVLPLCDRAPRRVIPLGKGPRSPRRHNIMDSRHSAHIIHIRQPHKPLLPPHDHHKHRVHLPQHADPGILRYARNEMDDVPHAADVPVHLQQLRRRPQLLLPPVTPHHNHHDIHLPQGRIRGEDASQDG